MSHVKMILCSKMKELKIEEVERMKGKRLLFTSILFALVLAALPLVAACAGPAASPAAPAAGGGVQVAQETCPYCKGTGLYGETTCSICGGTGKINVDTQPAGTEVIHWKAATGWTRGPGHQEHAEYFASWINRLSQGRLVIDQVYAADELMGAFECIPAVAEGKLDIGFSSGLYLMGSLHYISTIMGTAASRTRYVDEQALWMFAGGGLELYREYVQGVMPLIVFPSVIVPIEPVYTKKPVTKMEDWKGLKIRSSGLNVDFFNAVGASGVSLPMGEVVPALETGALDGAEFCVPYTDYPAGLHKVAPYCLSGYLHQPGHTTGEAWINLDTWNALPDDLKDVVIAASRMLMFWSVVDQGEKNMYYLEKMVNEGLKITKASDEFQAQMFKVGDDLAVKYSADDAWAKKILDSQAAFHAKYMKYGVVLPCYGNSLLPGAGEGVFVK